jgi:hypothetical protein
MKIVSINQAPKVVNADGHIKPNVKSLDAIVANIDTARGRNDALRAYIYALRDLQVANNDPPYSAADKAQAAVAKAFDALILAEFSLNRPYPPEAA